MEIAIKRISLLVILLVSAQWSVAQYTETINTNNPGRSQGAFAVGKNVAQVEGSLFYRAEEHDLQLYERDIAGFSFQLRYGALNERLEFSYIGSFDAATQTDQLGSLNTETSFSNFSSSTLGAKYLVFDPLVFFGEKEVNLLSWKANHSLDWRDLIPAVSVYAGANLNFSENNPFTPPLDPTISPKFALITQNNWGRWVFVMNFIVDRVTTDFPSYEWILTMTHSINGKWAIFGEYQGFKSDFYSDDLGRGGVAYLINKDWQVDVSGTLNFKDTPSLFQVNAGMSYRLDFHKDEEIKQTKDWDGTGEPKKKKKKKNKLNTEGDDGRGL
ncbi:transporter [Nonlabens xiamenensis]|uniref:transporter n=1 Tax=Nonlabens xiamenensis TaxID=2341043 RepID=UPI0013DE4E58|nr:transporter [Nonlabens xiamenensis]